MKTGINEIPLKPTQYAYDPNGGEHIFWEKDLPEGWRRKYVPASPYERMKHFRAPLAVAVLAALALWGCGVFFHTAAPPVPETAEDAHYGHPQRIDIAQIDPFSLPETAQEAEPTEPVRQIPVIPAAQPKPNLPPLPQIPVRTEAKEAAPTENYQSKIAFIGGDDIPQDISK